jgi:tRNA(fMet)-specific endonuclease VapC
VAYLLDTNACIFLINGTSERARKRFAEAAEAGEKIWVSGVSVFELWYGVFKSAKTEANSKRLKIFLGGALRVLGFEEEDARQAGELRALLERAGKPIGAYDLLIAGQALRHKLTLVTANTREFARLPGLQWEDWGNRKSGNGK